MLWPAVAPRSAPRRSAAVDTPLGSWSMMVVQIEKPANMTLAVWFTELRSWFDENNCQPTSFFPSGRVIDKLLFHATFAQNTQARWFASQFTRYAPVIRRAASRERGEILLDENWGGAISDERGASLRLAETEAA